MDLWTRFLPRFGRLSAVLFLSQLHRVPCGILVPGPGITPGLGVVKVPRVSHWSARERPAVVSLNKHPAPSLLLFPVGFPHPHFALLKRVNWNSRSFSIFGVTILFPLLPVSLPLSSLILLSTQAAPFQVLSNASFISLIEFLGSSPAVSLVSH